VTEHRPVTEIYVERYKYILQQLHASNENVHRFLALYQSLATAIAGAGLALFVGYKKWGIGAPTAQAGMVGLACLLSVVAGFTILLVISGVFTWLDYRKEECELANALTKPGFRRPPELRNFLRWYETYVILFVAASMVAIWALLTIFAIPNMR
jgi:uncharacterized iron-regulated membrane protein